MSQRATNVVTTIGIEIGKNSFQLIGLDCEGAIVLRQKLSRGRVMARLANPPSCLIGMEACVGAHHLSRQLLALGHDARLMPARYVKPFLKGQKNDYRDAEAIAEAVQRPRMRFVATKSVEQLDLQALHRVRARLVRHRTAVINQIRALLLERGIAVRQGQRFLRAAVPDILGRVVAPARDCYGPSDRPLEQALDQESQARLSWLPCRHRSLLRSGRPPCFQARRGNCRARGGRGHGNAKMVLRTRRCPRQP